MGSTIKYVHQLSIASRKQLCDILDADKKWQELGKNHMKLKSLSRIYQAEYCGKSPSLELLDEYSEKNLGTVNKLFIYLYRMNHERAMDILQPHVDEKLRRLRRNENTASRSLYFSNEEDITCSSVSQLSISSPNSLSQRFQGPTGRRYTTGACGTSYKNKIENESAINQNRHFNSWRSKSLQAPQVGPEVVSNKSPDLNQVQESALFEKKSISKKCAVDKMNEERKPCVQEMPLNGKQMKSTHPSSTNSNSQGDTLPDFMIIPYAEVCKMTDNFNKALILGKGGFGEVYRGEISCTPVAVKRITPKKCGKIPLQAVCHKQYSNELNILQCFKFDYILPLYAVSLDGDAPCLIYQFMNNGSLDDRLLCKNKTPPLTWSQRSHIAECTAKGLHYLHTIHDKPLVHGDIKSANILLDKKMDAKIGDFGLTRQGPDCNKTHVTVTTRQGTEFYLPDEYLRDGHLSSEVDIYSYGIVMFEIATGLRPYDRITNKRLIDRVKNCAHIGTLDELRDLKAGEENKGWFEKLVEIGQDCSRTQKRDRTPMRDVLGRFEKIKTKMSKMKEISSNVAIDALRVHPATPPITDEPLTSSKREARINNTEKSDSYSYVSSESSYWSEEQLNAGENMRNTEAPTFERKPEAETGVPPIPLLSDLQLQMKNRNNQFNSSEDKNARKASCFEGKAEAEIRDPPIPLLSFLQAEVKSNEREKNANELMKDREASSSVEKSEAQGRVPPIPLLSFLHKQKYQDWKGGLTNTNLKYHSSREAT